MIKQWLMLAALLLLSATMLTAQTSSAQSRTEEIVSSIAPEKWYKGSDVQDTIRSLLEAYVAELEATAKTAAEAAVRPCVVDLAGARASLQAALAELDGWRLAAVAGAVAAAVSVAIAALLLALR
jgi:Skp family chaperone for outer membrane proteins